MNSLNTITIFLIFSALFLSLGIAYFQYYYRAKNIHKINIVLFFLRFSSLFLLLLLLINPVVSSLEIELQKPILNIVIDDSKSISFFKEENTVNNLLTNIKENKELSKKFDTQFFKFSENINALDSLSFNGNKTNIYKAIDFISEVNKDNLAATILLSDGNQTIGNDYEYLKTKEAVYPIIIGDTSFYMDLEISQLNTNRYSYIKNSFPIEAIINYDGNEKIETNFIIEKNGRVVFKKKLHFSKKQKSNVVTTNLKSTIKGTHYYKAKIEPVLDEKNIKNNSKEFSIEVIDEKSKILILSSFLHPDLGALKKSIESNEQRSVKIELIQKTTTNLKGFQLVIFYQPTQEFKPYFDVIGSDNQNFMIITGSETDWNFINQLQLDIAKAAITQTENYQAKFNSGFLTFSQENIGFEDFPPLTDKFGEINLKPSYKTLLFQTINGLENQQPLLVTRERNNQKSAFILGEGIWKWRAASFLRNNSFNDFDKFINNLIQFTASKKVRKRLAVDSKTVYDANENIVLNAFYVDNNYIFDKRASITANIKNSNTNYSKSFPFSLKENTYQLNLEGLPSGNYTYEVLVENQNISETGTFIITNYEIEAQYSRANVEKLQRFAQNNNGKIFYKNQLELLINNLLEDKKYTTIQTSKKVEKPLVDIWILMFLIIAILSSEWFVRKYHGKI